jgi:hypothetical protein
MQYVIPGVVVLIVIMLAVLLVNARLLHRSGLSMREEIDQIRRRTPQAQGQPTVAAATPPQPERRPPEQVAAPVPASVNPAPAPAPTPVKPEPPPRVARPPKAAEPVPPAPPPLKLADRSRQAIESIVQGYNRNPDELKRRFDVLEFNLEALGKRSGALPVYRLVPAGQQGELWIVYLGEGVGCALPRPRPTYNLGQFRAAGMHRVFTCKGFTEGQRSGKAEVVKPAIFREAGEEEVEMVEQGILELHEIEKESAATTAPAKPKKAEKTPTPAPPVAAAAEKAPAQSGEAATVALLYQLNTERLYSDRNGVRVGVANLDALEQDQAAVPVFAPNPEGAFWILGGRFLVPRPGAMEHLPQVRPSPTRFFDCAAEGTGEPAQKNVLVRAASVQAAGDGWVLAERGAVQLAGENGRQRAVEEIVRLYRSDTEGLQSRYTVFQFGATNASQLEANPSESPRFGLLPTGPYWLLHRGDKERYAVPAPDLAVDDRLMRSSGFLALFKVTEYQTGRTYRKLELIRPARLELWNVVETGEVSLGEPEPELEREPEGALEAGQANPEQDETPEEQPLVASVKWTLAEMADIFNHGPGVFQERFTPARYGVRNTRDLETRAGAEPAFGPEPDGDYWLVEAGAGSGAGDGYAVPYPGIEVDGATIRHLSKVFKCMGYQAGRRYRGVWLVSPAVVRQTAPEGLRIVNTGVLALTEGEPDVDSD